MVFQFSNDFTILVKKIIFFMLFFVHFLYGFHHFSFSIYDCDITNSCASNVFQTFFTYVKSTCCVHAIKWKIGKWFYILWLLCTLSRTRYTFLMLFFNLHKRVERKKRNNKQTIHLNCKLFFCTRCCRQLIYNILFLFSIRLLWNFPI